MPPPIPGIAPGVAPAGTDQDGRDPAGKPAAMVIGGRVPDQSKYPISEACPQCGETRHKKVQAETPLSFASDRVCATCGTRYTPPMPMWGLIALLVVAGCLSLGGVALIVAVLSGWADREQGKALWCGIAAQPGAAWVARYAWKLWKASEAAQGR